MSNHKLKVLDIGQCDLDHGNISSMLIKKFGANVLRVAIGEEAFEAVHKENFDLVLVNRILDTDGASGLDLIQRLITDEDMQATPMMLVSNFVESQDAAVALGAMRGFGKDALNSTQTQDLLTSIFSRSKRSCKSE